MKTIPELIQGFIEDDRDHFDELHSEHQTIIGDWVNKHVFMKPALAAVLILFINGLAYGSPLTASWYSVESCLKEGSSGIMASGRKLDDTQYTAASWDYDFGTILKVTNLRNGRFVMVTVEDRGPAKRLYAKGRVLDLSLAAFKAIASPAEGIVPIRIERIR